MRARGGRAGILDGRDESRRGVVGAQAMDGTRRGARSAEPHDNAGSAAKETRRGLRRVVLPFQVANARRLCSRLWRTRAGPLGQRCRAPAHVRFGNFAAALNLLLAGLPSLDTNRGK